MDQEKLAVLTKEERTEVVQREMEHIKEIEADRNVSIRGNRFAEECAHRLTVDGQSQAPEVTIHGVDQTRFRCPTACRPLGQSILCREKHSKAL